MPAYPLSYARRYLGRRPSFRVNYGNGQCSHTLRSAEDARRHLRSTGGAAFIEWQDAQTGDWFQLASDGKDS